MKYFYILAILLIHLSLTAQIQRDQKAMYKEPEFLTNEPLWHYTVYDSTNIGSPIEFYPERFTDGYNSVTYIRPWNWKPIMEGDFMYAYTTSFGTTSHIFGAMIYRINITNGQKDWITVFDNRHSDRQEYVQSMDIKEDTLEVVTMRRYDTHINDLVPFSYNKFGADSYVCVRKYDKRNGKLIDYSCWDKDNPNVTVVTPHSEGNRIFEKDENGNYLYLNELLLNKKKLELSIISDKGELISKRSDTLFYPAEKYNDIKKLRLQNNGGKMVFLENDTILVGYNYDFENNIGRFLQPDLSYIQLYNKKFDLIGRLNLGKFVEMYYDDIFDISIRYATPENIVLHVNRTNNFNIVVIDYEVNIISDVEFKLGNNEFAISSGYLPYSNKSFMITQTYGPQNPPEIPQTLKYYIYENNDWELKFSQEMAENHYIPEIKYFTETPNHNVIICADHAYYNEDINLSCFETDMWMMIDGSKLGIKTSTIELQSESIVKVFPNPSNGIINFEASIPINTIEISDITGKSFIVYKEFPLKPIDISNCNSGVYILTFINDRNEVVNRSKVVKL